jgi:thioesterase domain-containing protein
MLALEGGDRGVAPARVNSIEEIAALYVDALVEAHPGGSFSIGGYSMSGFIAWEVARRLAALGRTPQCLVLLDCPRLYSFCSAEDQAWMTRVTSVRGRVSKMLGLLARPAGISRRGVIVQTLAGSLRRVRHETYDRWFAKQPPAWETDYRRNIDLSVRYRVLPYEGRVVLVRAATQADWFNRVQHDLGWTAFCRGEFSIIILPGDHHAMFVEPGVEKLARVLHAAVAEPTMAGPVLTP